MSASLVANFLVENSMLNFKMFFPVRSIPQAPRIFLRKQDTFTMNYDYVNKFILNEPEAY